MQNKDITNQSNSILNYVSQTSEAKSPKQEQEKKINEHATRFETQGPQVQQNIFLTQKHYSNPIQTKLSKMKKSYMKRSATSINNLNKTQMDIRNIRPNNTQMDQATPVKATDRNLLWKNNSFLDQDQCELRQTFDNKKNCHNVIILANDQKKIKSKSKTNKSNNKVYNQEKNKENYSNASRSYQSKKNSKALKNSTPFPEQALLTNSSSLRKLSLLERKSSRKDLSLNFYKNEYKRRQQKYQKQILKFEEKHQSQIASLQNSIIQGMVEERELDEDIIILNQMTQEIIKPMEQSHFCNQDSIIISKLKVDQLSLQTLLFLHDKIEKTINKSPQQKTPILTQKYQIEQSPESVKNFACLTMQKKNDYPSYYENSQEFTYTIQSITQALRSSKRSHGGDSMLLDETLQGYFFYRP